MHAHDFSMTAIISPLVDLHKIVTCP